MRCKDVKKLVHLKEHELTDNEQKIMQSHIEECEPCKMERDMFLKGLVVIDEVKQKATLNDPDVLTSDIMRSIRNIERYSKRRENPLEKLRGPVGDVRP